MSRFLLQMFIMFFVINIITFLFHQVAKAQLDEDMCVDAIASYIKAEDPSYYSEVQYN